MLMLECADCRNFSLHSSAGCPLDEIDQRRHAYTDEVELEGRRPRPRATRARWMRDWTTYSGPYAWPRRGPSCTQRRGTSSGRFMNTIRNGDARPHCSMQPRPASAVPSLLKVPKRRRCIAAKARAALSPPGPGMQGRNVCKRVRVRDRPAGAAAIGQREVTVTVGAELRNGVS